MSNLGTSKSVTLIPCCGFTRNSPLALMIQYCKSCTRGSSNFDVVWEEKSQMALSPFYIFRVDPLAVLEHATQGPPEAVSKRGFGAVRSKSSFLAPLKTCAIGGCDAPPATPHLSHLTSHLYLNASRNPTSRSTVTIPGNRPIVSP
jgi:hypothetical protein